MKRSTINCILILVILLLSFNGYGQGDKEEETRIMEYLTENDVLMDDAEIWFGMQKSIDLNKADYSTLRKLEFLSVGDIENLLQFRDSIGHFISIYELQQTGIEKSVLVRLSPYLFVNESYNNFTALKEDEFRHELILDWNRKNAATSNSFLGGPNRWVFRYRAKKGRHLTWGITSENDAGEAWSQKRPDYFSGYLSLHDLGILRNLCLGDYQIHFGEGLTMGSSFSMGKSTVHSQLKQSRESITPHRSLNENGGLRGVAGEIRWNSWAITGFVSSNYMDANIDSLNEQSIGTHVYASSFDISGYHRTASELQRKDQLQKDLYGGQVAFHKSGFIVGVHAVKSVFSKQVDLRGSEHRKWGFHGKSFSKLGLSHEWSTRIGFIFGEICMDNQHGLAAVQGLMTSLSPKINLNLHYRYYKPNFIYINSAGVSEYSTNSNEQGLFLGLEGRVSKQIKWNIFFDQYRSDWIQFNTAKPPIGTEIQGEIHFNPSRSTKAYIRIKHEAKQTNWKDGSPDRANQIQELTRMRLNFEKQLSRQVKIRVRLAASILEKEDQKATFGNLLYQDLQWKSKSFSTSCTWRLAFFRTDTYQNSLYAYENDVLYAFSIPAYHGEGAKSFVVLKLPLGKTLDIRMKVGILVTNESNINRFEYKTPTSTNLEFKCQIKWKL